MQTTLPSFFNEENYHDDLHGASVEEKRVRFDVDDENELVSKRRHPMNNDLAKEMRGKNSYKVKINKPCYCAPRRWISY